MILPAVEPAIQCFPGFVVMEKYDDWKMLFEIFGHYRLDEIRAGLWDMYKAAIKDDVIYNTRIERSNLTFFFERLVDLATASYVATREKWLQSDEYKKEQQAPKKHPPKPVLKKLKPDERRSKKAKKHHRKKLQS